MKKFIVFGLGTFGSTITQRLMEQGGEVLAVDSKQELVEEIKDKVTQAVCLDSTSEESLAMLGINDFDCGIVCMGQDMDASVLTTLLVKKLGIPNLIARAATSSHAQILRLIGASEVMEPEKEVAERLAKRLTSSHLLSYISLADDHLLAEIASTPSIMGQTIKDLDFRARFNINIIAVKKLVPEITPEGLNAFKEEIVDVPKPEDQIEESDILVVVGKSKNIESLKKEIEE
ncbi:MAG: TrkA family potassium uptake protein [Spirochaetes bacterium]|nr:TrkA family potassium uptake protein [Spirochaetota bacterium]